MSEFVIRSGKEADLAEVLALERGIGEAPHWAAAEYLGIVRSRARDAVRRYLVVAEIEERLVGFAVGKTAGAEGELESVAVSVETRRGGVGRALCKAVVDWCGSQGVRTVELEVREGSGGAIALYGDLGFLGVGHRRGYYRAPAEDALLMRMEL